MNKRTLSCYEIAWNMHISGLHITNITQVLDRDRSTIYRWLKAIKLKGIRKFLQDKKTAKHRRPSAQTPEYIIQKIVDIRNEFGWCGAKIRKELQENHSISLALSTIYRWLHRRFTRAVVGIRSYKKHKALVIANNPREVIEHDTVDLGGGVYAYTAIDIFTKEPNIVISASLEMSTGASAFNLHNAFYGSVQLHQSDNGSEFQTTFREAVEATGSQHCQATNIINTHRN